MATEASLSMVYSGRATVLTPYVLPDSVLSVSSDIFTEAAKDELPVNISWNTDNSRYDVTNLTGGRVLNLPFKGDLSSAFKVDIEVEPGHHHYTLNHDGEFDRAENILVLTRQPDGEFTLTAQDRNEFFTESARCTVSRLAKTVLSPCLAANGTALEREQVAQAVSDAKGK